MIYLEKSQPAPECLAKEKLKKSGDYKCGDVVARLKADFKNKCYICEEKEISSINVEHFKPHKNKDLELKFDWSNLYFACGHCNNTKLAGFDEILDCTKTNEVETKIKYEFSNSAFPKEQVIITSLDQTSAENLKTVELLKIIYCGNTAIKSIESGNIRNKISKEVRKFSDLIANYFSNDGLFDEAEKAKIKQRIQDKLSSESSFTAFKRWMIRTNPILLLEFEQFLN